MRSPVPSLPVCGTLRPPGAITTRAASIVPPPRAAGGDRAPRRVDRLATVRADAPGAAVHRGGDADDVRAEAQARAAAAGQVEQPVADVARPVGFREELAALVLQRQPDPHLLLEEPALVGQRPREEDL